MWASGPGAACAAQALPSSRWRAARRAPQTLRGTAQSRFFVFCILPLREIKYGIEQFAGSTSKVSVRLTLHCTALTMTMSPRHGDAEALEPHACKTPVKPQTPPPRGPGDASPPPPVQLPVLRLCGAEKEPPSWDEMQRRAFEVAMILRVQQTADAFEYIYNETQSLLAVISVLRAEADRDATLLHSGRCWGVQQDPPTATSADHAVEQTDAALSLGLARLRQHLRIKIADPEDLNCAQQALHEVADFFEKLAAMAGEHAPARGCSFELFQRMLRE